MKKDEKAKPAKLQLQRVTLSRLAQVNGAGTAYITWDDVVGIAAAPQPAPNNRD